MEVKRKKISSKYIAVVAFFGALSAILMFFDFPLPIAPAFMKMDLSDLPVIIGSFLLGPVEGVIISLMKILIKVFLKGTSTIFVGEAANFIGSVSYALPAAIIYGKLKTMKRAIIGLILGTIIASIVITICNASFIFPLYINLFNMSEEVIIGMCKAINPYIDSMLKVMLLSVFPFNIIKYTVTSIITFIFYKHISRAVKSIIDK